MPQAPGQFGVEPEDFLPGIATVFDIADGHIDLSAPATDIDGDSVLDTLAGRVGDCLVVVTDTDLDGVGDRVTWVDSEGAYECWKLAEQAASRLDPSAAGGSRWQLADRGSVADDGG